MMHNGTAGGYKHPKLFFSRNGGDHDNFASWAVHIKNNASDLVSQRLVMFPMLQDRSAVGMRACPHCRTPVLKNHRDDKAPDDKIRHVLLVIYCP